MKMSVGDLIDRYSIILLKLEHKPEFIYHKQEQEALEREMVEIRKTYPNIDLFLDFCKKINSQIWDLEADIRQGALDNDLPEVGRRAIMIRKINGLRVGFKNLINELLCDGFKESKTDHLSQ